MRPLLMLTMALAATGMVPCPYPPRKPAQASPEAQALAIRRAQEKRARRGQANRDEMERRTHYGHHGRGLDYRPIIRAIRSILPTPPGPTRPW